MFSRIRDHLRVHCWYIFELFLLVPTFSFSQYIRFIISKLSFFWRADDCGSSSGRPPGSHSSLSFLPRAFYPKGICRLNRVSPELQNPHFKAKENLLPWEKVPVRADEGWWIKALPGPSAIVCVSPSSPGGRGFFDGRMDSATSPLAPRRMTDWGE